MNLLRLRACLAAAVLAVAAIPGAARATDVGAGCGSQPKYTKVATCRLVFRGFPLYVFADAQNTGAASVHVWITVDEIDAHDPGGKSPIVFECTASGTGYAKCDQGFPNETTHAENTVLQQFHLQCHVQSTGIGAYRCVSGSGF